MSSPFRRPPLLLALCSALCAACAQVEQQPLPDGGVPQSPHVVDVQPAPGPVPPSARFHVAFSAAMDDSLLLADADHSETVVLVRAADADVMAAALAHGRLSTRLRALLVPAHAALAASAQSIDLAPDGPLPAGELFLLIASRLKDAAGRRLAGNGARFGYTVEAGAPLPALVAPRPGSRAPLNLARARLAVPAGLLGRQIALAGPGGALWSGTAPAGAGTLVVQLCPAGQRCSVLDPGASYALQLDGEPVAGADFSAADCRKEAPPVALAAQSAARDDRIRVDAVFDGPVLARLAVAKAPAHLAPGDDDAALTRLCAQGDCEVAEAATGCIRDGCATDAPDGGIGAGSSADGGGADPCEVHLEVSGLSPETSYLSRLSASDDEGHVAGGAAGRFTTSVALPHVLMSEVMSWPPPPAPRLRGQYVELLNAGSASVDLGVLALRGADGKVRPLAAAAQGPIVLRPGARALAVGASFDAARYPRLPPEVPVLRAATQRLLGRGLKEASPAPFSLVLVREGAEPQVLDSFPGGTSCRAGESLERTPQDSAEGASFTCGSSGGSPGRPP